MSLEKIKDGRKKQSLLNAVPGGEKMVIGGNNPVDGNGLLNKTADLTGKQGADKKGDARKPEESGDRVSLSGKAREISELKGVIEGLPDVRRDRVEALRHALDTGTYSFDTVKMAEKIFDEEFK